jgi:copper chaperone CopZ
MIKRTSISLILTSIVLTAGGCSKQEQPATQPDKSASAPGVAQPAIQTTTLRYQITGMHCDGCAANVKGRLSQIAGVSACDVSFASKTASVQVNDPAVEAQIIAAVKALNYQIEPALQDG